MNRYQSQISDRFSAEWLAGYRAALADLDAVLAALGTSEGIAPFVKARLKAHLLQRESGRQAA